MAAPVIGTRPGYAPRPNATVDRSHPLAAGLEFCFVPGRGNTDLVTGRGATLTGTPARSTTTRYGSGLTTVASPQTGWVFSGVPDAPFLGPIGLMFVGRFTSFPAQNQMISKCQGNGTSNSPFDMYLDSAGKLTLVRSRSTANSYRVWLFPTAVTLATDYVLVASYPRLVENTPSAWLNAASLGAPSSVGLSPNGAPAGNGRPIYVGRRDDTLASDATFVAAAAWSRELSGAEAAALAADPFCFLKD